VYLLVKMKKKKSFQRYSRMLKDTAKNYRGFNVNYDDLIKIWLDGYLRGRKRVSLDRKNGSKN